MAEASLWLAATFHPICRKRLAPVNLALPGVALAASATASVGGEGASALVAVAVAVAVATAVANEKGRLGERAPTGVGGVSSAEAFRVAGVTMVVNVFTLSGAPNPFSKELDTFACR